MRISSRVIGIQKAPRPSLKKTCVRSIVTHDGNFHCDEALAVWMLKQTARFRDAPVIRTRDRSLLEKSEILVDVGDIYDPDALRFDHHQPEFSECFDSSSHIQLSSCGLIYKHFGREVISEIAKEFELTDDELEMLYQRVYFAFIEALDAMDNGVPQCVTRINPMRKATKTFSDATGLTARVRRMNVNWRSPPSVTADGQFLKAVELCGNEFTEFVHYRAYKYIPARRYVHRALQAVYDISDQGDIMLLEIGCPWSRFLHELESEILRHGQVKYCIYLGEEENSDYRVHAVTISPDSNTPRLRFPKEWRGLNGKKIEEVTGIEGCCFVHRGGYIGRSRTKEGAIAMARKSIDMDWEERSMTGLS